MDLLVILINIYNIHIAYFFVTYIVQIYLYILLRGDLSPKGEVSIS